jgi:uroporphyrin-III C-methyltransferase
MASKQAGSIQDALLRSGYKGSTPAVFVESASFADRRIVPTTLAGIKAAAKQLGGGPSILLIGDVYEDVIGESSASLVAQSELILARQ